MRSVPSSNLFNKHSYLIWCQCLSCLLIPMELTGPQAACIWEMACSSSFRHVQLTCLLKLQPLSILHKSSYLWLPLSSSTPGMTVACQSKSSHWVLLPESRYCTKGYYDRSRNRSLMLGHWLLMLSPMKNAEASLLGPHPTGFFLPLVPLKWNCGFLGSREQTF